MKAEVIVGVRGFKGENIQPLAVEPDSLKFMEESARMAFALTLLQAVEKQNSIYNKRKNHYEFGPGA